MGAASPVRTNLEYCLVRSLIGLLGALPRPLAVGIGRCLGRAAYHFLGRLRWVGEGNLRIAFPHLSRAERRNILRASFDSLGRQLGEFALLPRATADSLRKVVEYDPESQALLEEAAGLGRGVIFATAHLGAWELLAFAQSAFGKPLSILVRPIENPKIERWVNSVRTRCGNETIGKKEAGLTCMRILRKGGTLGILADLNALPQEGVFVPFFTELACTTLAVAALALPTGAVVFPAFAPWDRIRRRYVFRGGPAIEMIETGDRERDLAVNTARVSSVIEKAIRAHPEQWLWIHDRYHARFRVGDRVCADFPPV